MRAVYRENARELFVWLVYSIEDDGHISVVGVFDAPDKARAYAQEKDRALTLLEQKTMLFHVKEHKVL